MTHILAVVKIVGDRVTHTYFEWFDKARKWIDRDIEAGRHLGLWGSVEKKERFLIGKGLMAYDCVGVAKNGEKVSWSIVDIYTSDHML